MDYTWGISVNQAIMQQHGYGNYQQYPQQIPSYEPYYMGHPWTAGSYAPMYPYGLPLQGYHQMAYPTKEQALDFPPTSKRARLNNPRDYGLSLQVCHQMANPLKDQSLENTPVSKRIRPDNPQEQSSFLNCTSEILNADESTAVPDSFELQIETNPLEYSNNNDSTDNSENLELNQSEIVNQHDSSKNGPLTSMLAAPLIASSESIAPTSPIKQVDISYAHINKSYNMEAYENFTDQQTNPHQLSFQEPIPSEQNNSHFIETNPFKASQVMVVLPNGTKSSIWDLQVPEAFASYQQPAQYNSNKNSTPGPKRRRRQSVGQRIKNNYCHLCEKTYESSYKLKLHMHAHTGERPFVCEVCGKGFARGPNLNAHRRVHTGEKPFSCNRCSRGFSHPTDRIVHMVTEVCVRAGRYIRRTAQGWECSACDSGVFESREQAERHARQHETGRGLACPVCQTNYQGQKAHVLVKHVRECHPEYMQSIGL